MTWLALDIGGANLKAADGLGWARSVPFALWQQPHKLRTAVGELIHGTPPSSRLAIAMTGELCGCFRAKAEGVHHILAAVEAAAESREVWVYLQTGRLVPSAAAMDQSQLAAASSWHALATFAGRYAGNSAALLIDVGSTTTDIVPIANGKVSSPHVGDVERLIAGELVYSGVGRTPISALVNELPYRGASCPVAAEYFATTADAYLLVGQIEERPEIMSAADGRPLTRSFARERLARMICADATSFSERDAYEAVDRVSRVQLWQLSNAGRQVAVKMPRFSETVIVSGSGEFLSERLALNVQSGAKIVSLSRELGSEVSHCASAHALAVLAREREKA